MIVTVAKTFGTLVCYMPSLRGYSTLGTNFALRNNHSRSWAMDHAAHTGATIPSVSELGVSKGLSSALATQQQFFTAMLILFSSHSYCRACWGKRFCQHSFTLSTL